MNDATSPTLSPLVRREPRPPVVRLRCLACDVAWTGESGSGCWVCGEEGTALNHLFLRRDPTTDALEEFDILR